MPTPKCRSRNCSEPPKRPSGGFGHDRIGVGKQWFNLFKQGRVERPVSPVKRPQLKPVPAELGEGLRDIPDPELRACLEALAASLDDERPAAPPINIPVLGRIGEPRRETNDQ